MVEFLEQKENPKNVRLITSVSLNNNERTKVITYCRNIINFP